MSQNNKFTLVNSLGDRWSIRYNSHPSNTPFKRKDKVQSHRKLVAPIIQDVQRDDHEEAPNQYRTSENSNGSNEPVSEPN
jgi:hypothetical protein